MWGDIETRQAHEIWQSDLMHSLRGHVARQEYPVDLCHGCIKAGLYPKGNAARMYSIHYARWYEDRFGTAFYPEFLEKVRVLPDSKEIFSALTGAISG